MPEQQPNPKHEMILMDIIAGIKKVLKGDIMYFPLGNIPGYVIRWFKVYDIGLKKEEVEENFFLSHTELESCTACEIYIDEFVQLVRTWEKQNGIKVRY